MYHLIKNFKNKKATKLTDMGRENSSVVEHISKLKTIGPKTKEPVLPEPHAVFYGHQVLFSAPQAFPAANRN